MFLQIILGKLYKNNGIVTFHNKQGATANFTWTKQYHMKKKFLSDLDKNLQITFGKIDKKKAEQWHIDLI